MAALSLLFAFSFLRSLLEVATFLMGGVGGISQEHTPECAHNDCLPSDVCDDLFFQSLVLQLCFVNDEINDLFIQLQAFLQLA
jgi:hypothetical protein